VWDISITFLIVVQAAWIAFLLFEHNRRTKLESEREKTAEALRESESRNRAILDALPDMMFLMDERGTYLDWHASDPRDLYVPPEKFLGRTMQEIMPSEVGKPCAAAFEQVLSTGKPARVEYSLQLNGQKRYFETRIVLRKDRKLFSIARDITELKRAEIELQQLSSQLINLQDDERRRIARELHDTTAQHLFAITINLENLKRMGGGISRAGVQLLSECRDLCERSLQEVRTLSYLRHPPSLEDTGLVSALRWYAEGFRKRAGIAIDFQVAPGMVEIPAEMQVDLFRVVQEGLFNVFRHSGTRSATIFLECQEDHVSLRIHDSGRTILEHSERIEKDAAADLGIASIRERLRRWGGQLKVESNDQGELFLAELPLSAQEKVTGAKTANA
jgi:PAS domain S-box-containing protein